MPRILDPRSARDNRFLAPGCLSAPRSSLGVAYVAASMLDLGLALIRPSPVEGGPFACRPARAPRAPTSTSAAVAVTSDLVTVPQTKMSTSSSTSAISIAASLTLVTLKRYSPRGAGPASLSPSSALNVLLWQGQT